MLGYYLYSPKRNRGHSSIRRSSFLYLCMSLPSLGFILIVCSGLIDVKNLQPVLEEGILPVLKVVFTQTYVFPFCRSHCVYDDFTVFKKPKEGKSDHVMCNRIKWNQFNYYHAY